MLSDVCSIFVSSSRGKDDIADLLIETVNYPEYDCTTTLQRACREALAEQPGALDRLVELADAERVAQDMPPPGDYPDGLTKLMRLPERLFKERMREIAETIHGGEGDYPKRYAAADRRVAAAVAAVLDRPETIADVSVHERSRADDESWVITLLNFSPADLAVVAERTVAH
jgi:hypothetical protein